jgi:hypothetical protein
VQRLPVAFGASPGAEHVVRDVRLDRVVSYLAAAFGMAFAGRPIASNLPQVALALPDDDPFAPVAAAARAALELDPCGPRGLAASQPLATGGK